MNNLKRVMAMIRAFRATWQFIQSLFRWENKTYSGVAFLVSTAWLSMTSPWAQTAPGHVIAHCLPFQLTEENKPATII